MTQATKSLSVIFTVLFAATLLVKLQGGNAASEVFRSAVVSVDTARVNRVIIDRPANGSQVTLRENNGNWTVSNDTGEESFPADGSAIKRAIEQLNGLNVKAVATRDPDKYTRYKADSTGTKVSLYDDDRMLSSLIIGAPQIVSRREFNNYVRRPGDEPVYTVEGFLGPTFNKELNGWRDKTVWDLEESNISRIDFLFPADSSYSLERAGNRHWVTSGDTLDSGATGGMLSRLSTLRASGFVDSLTTEAFGNELYAIQIRLQNGVQKTLRLKAPTRDNTRFHATATDFPFVFTLNKSSFENSVLQSRASLLDG